MQRNREDVMALPKSLWVMITLSDCNGQNLASWKWDELYPGTPPRFTYPNENASCPYFIEFRHVQIWKDVLACGEINRVIDDAIVIGIERVRQSMRKGG